MDQMQDFTHTGAIIGQLDLIISVDTAVAHLAGALGKPVWVLLPDPPDWRWLTGRNDSPWYPTMRLFRQQDREGWGPLISRVAESLTQFKDLRLESAAVLPPF
jgi:ADP-heptose:LPS heptosyltransferase